MADFWASDCFGQAKGEEASAGKLGNEFALDVVICFPACSKLFLGPGCSSLSISRPEPTGA